MILLDTNIISELLKLAPNDRVVEWLRREPESGAFTTTITEAELLFGVESMPRGRRRENLAKLVSAVLGGDFADRILPFDSPAALAYAVLVAERKQAGRPISQLDAQIAAIARSRGSALATRNTADFEACGIELINPWDTKKS